MIKASRLSLGGLSVIKMNYIVLPRRFNNGTYGLATLRTLIIMFKYFMLRSVVNQ